MGGLLATWMLSAMAFAAPPLPLLAGAGEGVAGADEFAQAVEAYRAGDWSSAETLWRDQLDDPRCPDRVSALYNLGNAAWRQEQPLEAAAWYTACIRLAPRHAEAWANLEFVRAEAGVEPADRGDLTSTTRRFLFALTRGESEWLALACAGLFALAVALEALLGGALFRRLVAGTGVVLLIGLAPWVAQLVRGDARALMVVSAEGGAVRSEPAPEASLVGRFAPGSEVRYVDELPGWVRATDGASEGWVELDVVRALTAPFEGRAD